MSFLPSALCPLPSALCLLPKFNYVAIFEKWYDVPLSEDYRAGLLVVQDGSNEPAVVFGDLEDGEIQNFNTNFKFVSLANFESAFANLPA